MCDERRRAMELARAVGVEYMYTPSGEHMVCMLDVCVIILTVVYIVMPLWVDP